MKRIVSIALVLALFFCISSSAFAERGGAEDAADVLHSLGLFAGVGTDADGNPIYDLDRAPTRAEAVTMLVRLLGKEEEAKAGTWDIPFTDVADWAKPYVGYAYANGLTSGTGATTFGGSSLISATQYLTFILRALGYSSSTDFKWNEAWVLSDQLGITSGEYGADSSFKRADVCTVSVSSLNATQKNSIQTLADKLVSEGVFTKTQYDNAAIPAGWDGSVAAGFDSGTGTQTSPYRITSADQLAYLAKQVNAGQSYSGSFFVLENNLNLSGREWTPIGNYAIAFGGTFDGNNHTIAGLSITKADTTGRGKNEFHDTIEAVGLFGEIRSGATIQNLTVRGKIHIDKEDAPERDDIIAGGVVGFCRGTLRNCHNQCDVFVAVPSAGTYINAGGVAGTYTWVTSCLDGCSNAGTILGKGNHVVRCGGIAGDCDGYGTVINCWNSGNVTAEGAGNSSPADAGGISCHAWYATVENCCNTGTVTATHHAGGIMSYFGGEQAEDSHFCNCWSLGNIKSSRSSAGYIADYIYCGYIDACYGYKVNTLKAVNSVRDDGEIRSTGTFSSVEEMRDQLNDWVTEHGTEGNYAKWVIPNGTEYPLPIG